MSLFRRRPQVDPAEVASLREELHRLRTDLDLARADVERAEHTRQAEQTRLAADQRRAEDARLKERLVASSQPALDLPPPEPGASLAELRSQLSGLAERLSANATESAVARELVTAIGSRLDGLASELTNQIDELAGEIEALHQRTTVSGTMTPDALEALRSGQIRLANEQARYEIAFRQDLATLADELRRPQPGTPSVRPA